MKYQLEIHNEEYEVPDVYALKYFSKNNNKII